MAMNDILAVVGETQDFIVEIPAGNSAYFPNDILMGTNETILCSEVPAIVASPQGGGNIFIMSE